MCHCCRKIRVKSGEARLDLWRKLLCIRIYCSLLNEWLSLFLVPTALTLRTAIAFCFYVVLRREGIPGWAAAITGYAGLMMGGMFLWHCYEALSGIRLTDDVAQTLMSTKEKYFQRLMPDQQLYLVKLGKAWRGVRIDFGPFMEFSVEVPLTVLDEVLGQLLFLLSL